MKKTTAKKKTSRAPGNEQIDPRFAPVVEAFAKNRQVTRGRMMSSCGLRINGKIFAMFSRGRFVTKLPRERVDQLVCAGKGERFDPWSRKADEGVGGRRRGESRLHPTRERSLRVRQRLLVSDRVALFLLISLRVYAIRLHGTCCRGLPDCTKSHLLPFDSITYRICESRFLGGSHRSRNIAWLLPWPKVIPHNRK